MTLTRRKSPPPELGVRALTAALALALLIASGAHAADRYIAEVYLELDRVEEALVRGGYEQSHSHVVDKLDRDASKTYPVSLDRGLDYAIVSVCDSDCDDVDVHVIDENGNQVGADRAADDLPVIALTPAWSGAFSVVVTLSGCRARRCTIGIGFFAQPSAPDMGRDA